MAPKNLVVAPKNPSLTRFSLAAAPPTVSTSRSSVPRSIQPLIFALQPRFGRVDAPSPRRPRASARSTAPARSRSTVDSTATTDSSSSPPSSSSPGVTPDATSTTTPFPRDAPARSNRLRTWNARARSIASAVSLACDIIIERRVRQSARAMDDAATTRVDRFDPARTRPRESSRSAGRPSRRAVATRGGDAPSPGTRDRNFCRVFGAS